MGNYITSKCEREHRDFQRQGYATEMAQGMMEYARGQGAEKLPLEGTELL